MNEDDLEQLKKITAEHYGPELAELVRVALNQGQSGAWRSKALALMRKIEEGRME